jgi:hypothetical protein
VTNIFQWITNPIINQSINQSVSQNDALKKLEISFNFLVDNSVILETKSCAENNEIQINMVCGERESGPITTKIPKYVLCEFGTYIAYVVVTQRSWGWWALMSTVKCSMNHVSPPECKAMSLCEGASKSFRTQSITKCTLTTIKTRWEATQRFMAKKLTRLTQKIAIQLNLVAESCSTCSSRSRRPVRKLLDTPS